MRRRERGAAVGEEQSEEEPERGRGRGSLKWESGVSCHVAQACLRPCHPVDCSPPGSSVRGILQARILEWVAMPSFRGSSHPRDRTRVSYVSCTGRAHQLSHRGSPSTFQQKSEAGEGVGCVPVPVAGLCSTCRGKIRRSVGLE